MKKLLILASVVFALCFLAAPSSQAGVRVGVGFYGPRVRVGVGVPVYYGPSYYGPAYYGGGYYGRPYYGPSVRVGYGYRGGRVYRGRVCR